MSEAVERAPRIDELRSEIASLRRQLAPGALIVPVASVRVRDRGEACFGGVAPLGLASSLFFDEQFGEYTAMDAPRVYLFEGTLSSRHIKALVPLFEQVARDRAPLVMAASEVDEEVLAMVALNKRRGSIRGVLLVPTSPPLTAPLYTLKRLTSAGLGSAAEAEVRVEPPGVVPRMLATLREVVIFNARVLPTDLPTLGLLYVGGDDLAMARARAEAARELLVPELN